MEQNDHFAYFGDGNAAQIIDFKEYIHKSTGVKFVRFIFIPSLRIEQTYDIKERQDQNRMIVCEYPETEVKFLERGTYRTRCWIFTDFVGGPTPVSRMYQDLKDNINDNYRIITSLRAAKDRSYEELDKEFQHQLMAFRAKTDMVREVGRARGNKQEDNDVEEPSNG